MTWLALKIPPPVITLIFIIVIKLFSTLLPVTPMAEPLRIVMVIALVLMAIIFVGAGTIGFKLAQTTINPHTPEKSSQLVQQGIYRISRNPTT